MSRPAISARDPSTYRHLHGARGAHGVRGVGHDGDAAVGQPRGGGQPVPELQLAHLLELLAVQVQDLDALWVHVYRISSREGLALTHSSRVPVCAQGCAEAAVALQTQQDQDA